MSREEADGLFWKSLFHPCVERGSRPRLRPVAAVTGVALLLVGIAFGMRWPVLTFPFELNPDETMMAAQAITLVEAPVFYDRVDGTTGGPLLSYVLVAPAVFGMPITFFSGRCIGLGIFLLGVMAVAGLLWVADHSQTKSGWVAAAIALLSTLVYALTTTTDFGSYHSELVPACLVAWAEALLLSLVVAEVRRQSLVVYLVGLLCGALPFAKLQAVPIGIAIAGLGYGLIWLGSPGPAGKRIRLSSLLTAGGLTVPIAFMALFYATGVWDQFLLFGLMNNWQYAGQGGGVMAGLLRLFTNDLEAREVGLECFIGALAAVGTGGLVWIGIRRVARPLTPVICSLIVLVSAVISVAMPGRGFAHYWMLALFPACIYGGLPLLFVQQRRPRLALAMLLFGIGLLGMAGSLQTPLSLRILRQDTATPSPEEVFPAVRPLRAMKMQGDRLVCWGWQPSYHVYTQLPMGWPGANYVFLDRPQTLSPSLKKHIAFDLSSNSQTGRVALDAFRDTLPRFVVDVTGPNAVIFRDREVFGIQACREFAALVESQYDLVHSSSVDRLYVRKDIPAPRAR